jgi:hypothetical protein
MTRHPRAAEQRLRVAGAACPLPEGVLGALTPRGGQGCLLGGLGWTA